MKRAWTHFGVLVALTVLVAACTQPESTPVPTPTLTLAPTFNPTPSPTSTPTQVPSPTPTRTPPPTPTLTPTPAPPTPTITPALEPTLTLKIPPLSDCTGVELEREIISRTLAERSAEIQKKQPLSFYGGEVVVRAGASCRPNGVFAGFGFVNSFWRQQGGKLPSAGFSMIRFDTEADAAAIHGSHATDVSDRNNFNNCPAFFVLPVYPPVGERLEWQVSHWIFSVDNYDDSSSFLEGLGLDTYTIGQRMYEVGAELRNL